MNNKEMLFCGEQRLDGLSQLIAAYDAVAQAAGAPKGSDPTGPSHRVVLIEGDRGVGKTRLAMELYRHITEANDPENYWPADFGQSKDGFDVMPRAETCSFAGSPAFLWWGMRILGGNATNSTLFGSLEHVFPHLAPAEQAGRKQARNRSALAEGGDLAVDMALAALEEVPVIGTAKRLGQTAWKIGAFVKDRRAQADNPMLQARERSSSIVDDLMSDLTRLFSPASKEYSTIPLIIFLDDAQFANNDPAMASFVERVIASAHKEGWPLLLILTHWSSELNHRQDAEGNRLLPSHIARVLKHGQDGHDGEPGPFAKQDGGFIPEGSFVHIDLSELSDDMTPAITDQFTGLDDADVQAIAEKSSFNPRKLEQILTKMQRYPVWFDGPPATSALTPDGREKVMALADLDILDVVLDRFADTPLEVRSAMVLASLFGSRFIVQFVERISQSQLSKGARAQLEKAETDHRFIKDAIERDDNDLAHFTERLFFDAAEAYQSRGLVQTAIPDWPADDVLQAALDALLEQFVQAPETFKGFAIEDTIEGLATATTRMVEQDNPLAGLALARLVELENTRGNAEGAYDAAIRFMDGFSE